MSWMRRLSPFVALALLGPVVFTFVLPPRALAERSEATSDWQTEGVYDEGTRSDLSSQLREQGFEGTDSSSKEEDEKKAARLLAGAVPPNGGGGAQPQATALPSGPGTVSGMGESFSAQLSTGTVSMGVPFTLPPARGRVQPRLDLAYSSGSGFGLVGYGWSLGVGAISRQTYKGTPTYDDREAFHAEQDRFMFGGSELVPICIVKGTACSGAQAGERMPVWASGWQYFRARIEGGFVRFFWAPNHRTWRAQAKDGTSLEFGVPLDGTDYEGALERNPERPEEVYRWYLARQYDNQGVIDVAAPRPVNTIVYRYFSDGAAVYLSDIFDTSPAQDPTTTDVRLYAHHVALRYAPRPDRAVSYRAGFRMEHALRAIGVDVTSKPFAGADPTRAPRELVRRYDFRYDPSVHASLLVAVIGQGRCSIPVYENAQQKLPPTQCPTLPPLEFKYQRVQSAEAPLTDAGGLTFEPFASRIQVLPNSPPHSLGGRDVGTLDANNDGLVDILVTDAGAFGGRHGLYLNSADGVLGYKRLEYVEVDPLRGVDASVLRFSNSNVSSLDLDADGRVDLVHMPMVLNYEVFSLRNTEKGFAWSGRPISTAGLQDPKINFARDSKDTRTMDVNGDGLIDVVYSSPTELQTFFGLGGFPGGDGQFGQGRWTGPATADLTTEPVRTCAPWSAQSVRFSDADVRLADMNGDGLVDLARLRDGQLLYWPGRGNGFFGTGQRDDCAAGAFGVNRHVEVANAPRFGVNHSGVLHLGDVNGDGLADVVEIKSTAVDIYLNENGESFTDRTTLDDVPFLPPGASWGVLTDIDGSGTLDVVWAHAHEYKYIDLTGGISPYLLVETSNGLGRTMELRYRSGTELARAARAEGRPWQSHAPVATSVVVSSTVRDHLGRLGRPEGFYRSEYAYRDPVFDEREREFRGFREATTRSVGDSTSPTASNRQYFLLGECNVRDFPNIENPCGPQNRWRDNPREALKGQAYLDETFDERGVFLTTGHQASELKQLYEGLDGRRVVAAFPVRKETFVYDTSAFDKVERVVPAETVRVTLASATYSDELPVRVRATARTARLRTSSSNDSFGNTLEGREDGCIEGCPGGVDESVIARSVFGLPSGDGSGWLWREQSSYVTGTSHTERRNELRHEYDARGNRLRSFASLRGTLALDRFHSAGGAVAPAPFNQSGGVGGNTTQIVVSENGYDEFGNLNSKRGPTGACSSSVSDSAYAQLIVAGTSRVGTLGADGCGQTALVQRVSYDRGLATPVEATAPNGERSRFTFDGFGRVTSLTFAHPTTPFALATQPSAIFTYDLPSDWTQRPYVITHSYTQDGADSNSGSYRHSYAFVDGLGRTIASASEADRDAGDEGDWVVSGRVDYNIKGQVVRSCDNYFFSGDVFSLPWTNAAANACQRQESDAFGRPLASYRYDGLLQNYQRYGALTADGFDAADIEAGPRQNTYTTTVVDGHGRQIRNIERIRVSGQIEEQEQLAEYLPTGQVERSIQRRAGSQDVVRWMRYDSLGRMVLNVEPNTALAFTPSISAAATSLKAFRYAYDDAGALVGTSDARGCGSNYFYDAGGRLIAEDYSPCSAHHAPYTAPNLVSGYGTEQFVRYDVADPQATQIVDGVGRSFALDSSRYLGRVAAVYDRAAKSVFRYDVQGRGTGTAVRLAKPGVPLPELSSRYAPRWYTMESTLDALDRPTTVTTGAAVPELMGADGTSELRFSYAKSGATRSIGSSYGALFARARHFADGRVRDLTMGDAAATQRAFSYDVNHRIQTVQTYRSNLGIWSNAPAPYRAPSRTEDPTTQMLLEDYEYSYDRVGGIKAIADHRDPADWPASVQPVRREFEYDDLYRITEARYIYAGGQSTWQSPFAAENADAGRPQPVPHQGFARRVSRQTFAYDHLGNMVSSDDDAHAFWDRSTGSRQHGSALQGPHQLRTAANRASFPSAAQRGDLDVRYDAAGQVTDLLVRREGECLPAGSSCWQRFHYDWDEIGNLMRARRWDLSAETGERVSLNTLDAATPPAPPTEGLFHWYKAERCTATPYISCQDLQGNGNAGNGSPGRTPSVVGGALAGRTALVPDGSMAQGPVVNQSPATPIRSEYTMSFVAAIDGDGAQQLWASDTSLSASERSRVYLQVFDAAGGSRVAWRAHPHFGVGLEETATDLQASVPRGRPFITTIRASNTATELYIDGVLAATGGPTIPTAIAGYFGYGHAMRMGEGLMYSRPLDSSELARLHTYLRERFDVGGAARVLPVRPADVELLYSYSGTERMMKAVLTQSEGPRHTLYVFPSLEARGVKWSEAVGDYALDPTGVSVRLHAGPVVGRVIHSEADLPSLSSSAQHVFLQFADHLGSTTFTIDHGSGELVEFTTYQAYGSTESDYRPGRWASFREPYKFGGKEEDIEVGLMYFGARYYSPYAAIWLSPDPETIHDLGSDYNPYAYVGGSPIMNVDPDGRELCTLAVLGIIAAVSAIIAATTSVTIQAVQGGGIDEVNWGLSGVAGAALAGAVSGFVGGAAGIGVGAVAGVGAAGASTAASVGGAVLGGAVGGAVGGAAGYLVSAGLGDDVGGRRFRGKAFGKAVGLGALAGAVSAFAGGGLSAWGGLSELSSSILGSVAGAGTGYGVGAAIDGRFSALDLIVSLGGSVAGVLATRGVTGMFNGNTPTTPGSIDIELPDADSAAIDNVDLRMAGGGGGGKVGVVSRVLRAGGKAIQKLASRYPSKIDPRTGRPVFMPKGKIRWVPPHKRVAWGTAQRNAFIKEWYKRGYKTPKGGWEKYDIHHILPRAFGGTNDFDNLVPLLKSDHKLYTAFWQVFGSSYSAILFDFVDITGDGEFNDLDVWEWFNPGFIPVTDVCGYNGQVI